MSIYTPVICDTSSRAEYRTFNFLYSCTKLLLKDPYTKRSDGFGIYQLQHLNFYDGFRADAVTVFIRIPDYKLYFENRYILDPISWNNWERMLELYLSSFYANHEYLSPRYKPLPLSSVHWPLNRKQVR